MAKRCEHCKFWRDSVFKGETPSGWGIWWGDCGNRMSPSWGRENMHSLFFACEAFVAREGDFTTKDTKEHEEDEDEGMASHEQSDWLDDGEPDFTLDDLEFYEEYPELEFVDEWDDDDDPDGHGLECTCEDCIQNHPEREIYLDDEGWDARHPDNDDFHRKGHEDREEGEDHV